MVSPTANLFHILAYGQHPQNRLTFERGDLASINESNFVERWGSGIDKMMLKSSCFFVYSMINEPFSIDRLCFLLSVCYGVLHIGKARI